MSRQQRTAPRSESRLAFSVQDRLLNAREIADVLNVSVRMIYRLTTTGDLAKVKLGKAARFRLSDVEALVQKGAT